jgi:hypothetical protein
LEVESVNLAQLDYLKRLEAIRDEIIEDRKQSKEFLDHITEAIRLIEGGGEMATHPDLPPRTEHTTQQPHQEPLKKKQTYENLTTTSSVIHVLGRSPSVLLNAKEVCERLVDGGWGEGMKDPLSSTRACLSGMGKTIKAEKIGGILHYGLLPVEET